MEHHLLMEEWRSSRKACGMEILWPFFRSTICHIPVLKLTIDAVNNKVAFLFKPEE